MLFHLTSGSVKSSAPSYATTEFIFLGRVYEILVLMLIVAGELAFIRNRLFKHKPLLLPVLSLNCVVIEPSKKLPKAFRLITLSLVYLSFETCLAHWTNRSIEKSHAPASIQHSATSSNHCINITVLFADQGPALDAIICDCQANRV